MVTYHFEHEMGKGTVLGLSNNEQQQRPSHQVSESYVKKLGLFSDEATYGKLAGMVAKGATIKTTRLSDSFTYDDYKEQYKERAIKLCAIDTHNHVQMFTTSNNVKPKAEWKIVSLVNPEKPLEKVEHTTAITEESKLPG